MIAPPVIPRQLHLNVSAVIIYKIRDTNVSGYADIHLKRYMRDRLAGLADSL
jgi:hypothetical protein